MSVQTQFDFPIKFKPFINLAQKIKMECFLVHHNFDV